MKTEYVYPDENGETVHVRMTEGEILAFYWALTYLTHQKGKRHETGT